LELASFLDVELVGSTLRNGRIYFNTTDQDFFPADSYGDRDGGNHGIAVEFVGEPEVLQSDIRYLSANRIDLEVFRGVSQVGSRGGGQEIAGHQAG
jgi:hypothetical protein